MFGETEREKKKGYHLSHLHNKRFEPVALSRLSNYTTKSNGNHAKKQYFQFGHVSCFFYFLFCLSLSFSFVLNTVLITFGLN